MKKITFNIATREGPVPVKGYSFDFHGLHLVAHKRTENDSYWKVSEYTTGYAIAPSWPTTRKAAIEAVKSYLEENGFDRLRQAKHHVNNLPIIN